MSELFLRVFIRVVIPETCFSLKTANGLFRSPGSLIIDLFILLDLPLEILLFKTLRSNSVEDFGHVFIRCLNCIILCNICTYILYIFISEPSGTFGIFLPFYKNNADLIGRIRMIAVVIFSVHSEHWNTVLAISRLCAVLSPFRFNQIFTERTMNWITYAMFAWTLATSVPAFVIEYRYFNKTDDGDIISFSMKGPTTATLFMNYYTAYMAIVVTIITILIYLISSIALFCTSLQNGDKKWNSLAVRITLVAVLSNIPKVVWCYAQMYNNIEAFVPELNLAPMPLDMYMMLLKIGTVVYAFGTSFLMVIFFPRTRQKIIEQVWGKTQKATPLASISSTMDARKVFVSRHSQP